MIYTARYAHLEKLPEVHVGETVKPKQQKIAVMGNSGQSTAAHVHFDIIQRAAPQRVYRLHELIGKLDDLQLLLQQYQYFLDVGFFGVEPKITTYFGDPGYLIRGEWKYHPAYDLVPMDRKDTCDHWGINWNRSMPGIVTGVGHDEMGYGNYLTIEYEAN